MLIFRSKGNWSDITINKRQKNLKGLHENKEDDIENHNLKNTDRINEKMLQNCLDRYVTKALNLLINLDTFQYADMKSI